MGNVSSINFSALNQDINRYVPIPLLFFGIIGNILNILIFTRKIFRKNTCISYFWASTIFDSFVLLVGLIPRLLNGFNVDPSQHLSILCKLRFFITYFSGYAAAWFISLACFERYLSSSKSISKRQMMTMKRVYFSIFFILIFGFLAFGQHFYCIDINQHLLGAPQSCYQLKQNMSCQIVDSLMQCLFEILLPAFMMIIFGMLTVRNIHHTHLRIHVEQIADASIPVQQRTRIGIDLNVQSLPTRMNRTIQKRDVQLITMLLVQVIVFVISAFPISIYKLYSIATIYDTKSVIQKSIENTIFNLSVISLFLNNTITFYIYTLSGTIFRKELIKLLRFS
ncbi:hypothetical protein I4U23_027739 [Adineta vaga]|nr:hypothetical protein I4U23_027739 [Adineta vaga]